MNLENYQQNKVQLCKKGGIYINPKNRGKFIATKKKTGKSTEELTHSKNPITKKRAIFAQNAKKWKHEDGGSIDFLLPLIEEFKKGGKLSKEYIKKAHEKPGGSNVGKKKFASGAPRTGPYAGPSGGAPKGSYPIPDKKHAKSALSLAHHAPNPEGIKSAVYRKYPELRKHQFGGYLSPTPEYVLPKINFDALTQKFPSYLEQQQSKKINTFTADEVLPVLDKFEGFRPRVYKDGKGNLTIGHGLTDAKYLKRGFITRSDSLQGVKEHLNTQVLPKLESMSYWNNLNDNQKVALSSYVYNIGWNNFTKKSPNLQKALQSNDWNNVVKNLDFGYSDRANPGLRKRRDYERNLFLNSNETETLKKGGNLTKDYIKVAEYHKYLESKHTKKI